MTRTTDTRRTPFSTILDFYLFSNLHMAICAVAMVDVTRILFDFRLRSELYVFVFCGTFFLYNLQRLPAAFTNTNVKREFRRHSWNTENRKLLAGISIVAAIAAAWAFFQLYRRTQLIALIPAIVSVAYAFPALYMKGKWIKLREIPGIKIFLVGIVWGMTTAWIPAAADNSFPPWTSPEIMIWMIACSLMIVAITIPFDIRDLYYDGQRLKTLPAIFGLRNVKIIGIGLMFASVAGMVVIDRFSTLVTMHHTIVYSTWSAITCVVIAYSHPERHEYYYSFLVDGLMIVLWAMLFIL